MRRGWSPDRCRRRSPAQARKFSWEADIKNMVFEPAGQVARPRRPVELHNWSCTGFCRYLPGSARRHHRPMANPPRARLADDFVDAGIGLSFTPLPRALIVDPDADTRLLYK